MNRIKKLRKEKGLTVAELASDIGISQSMLSNYENGNSQPRDQNIWKELAKTFDVSVSYLMGLSNERPVKITDLDTFLNDRNRQTKGLPLTLNGIDSAFLTDNDISIKDIYDELDVEKQKVLLKVSQALLTSQIFEQSN